jgi:EmrB/QacA subfamily drug resistance transporter
MPSTLSIITNIFPANERGRAISIWAGVAALGVPLGPVLGGILLDHYSWGSVFFINVPVVLIALLVGWFLVPESRDPQGTPPDLLGAILSIGGLVALVYGVIEAPQKGWTGQTTLISWTMALGLLVAFIAWELRTPHPMLPMAFFRNRQFDGSILSMFLFGFSLFGSFFLLTQYLQYVRGFTPLEAGVRLLPIIALIIGTQVGVRLSERLGLKFIVPVGLLFVALGIALLSRLTIASGDAQLLWTLAMIGFSVGTVVALSAAAILGSVPVARAGIGSAMTTVGEQLGGALGVAILGSLLNTSYGNNINGIARHLPPRVPTSVVTGSLNGALAVAQRLGGPLGSMLSAAARSAYTDGMSSVLVIAAIIVVFSAVVVGFILPYGVGKVASAARAADAPEGIAKEPMPTLS